MFGNILYGSSLYGDKLLGVSVAEVQADISQSQLGIILRVHGALSSWHTVVRDSSLDRELGLDLWEKGHSLGIAIGLEGGFEEFGASVYLGFGFGVQGTFIPSEVVATGELPIGLHVYGDLVLIHPDDNAFAWSNIGSMDFTIGSDNVAGKSPLELKGYIYGIYPLGDTGNILVYNKSGITLTKPSGVFYGAKVVYRKGVKNKLAITNTGEDGHFFVNGNSELCQVTVQGKIIRHGFREFLNPMGFTVLSYDEQKDAIYICDGTYGFVYSIGEQGLFSGPVNITGVGYQNNEKKVLASDIITVPSKTLSTNILDFGTPKNKNIDRVKISANDFSGMTLGISFRILPSDSFSNTPTVDVNPDGVGELHCFGREFIFNIGSTAEDLKIYEIKIEGMINDFNPIDTVTVT